jgi:virginiamycin B lyase
MIGVRAVIASHPDAGKVFFMTPSNTHPENAARELRRSHLLPIAGGLLAANVRRRWADRVRTRPRLELLEDRCLLSPTITEFPTPTASANPWGITAGPDGNLWFAENGTGAGRTGGGAIGMINPVTDTITEFPATNAFPRMITTGADGNLWFTASANRSLGQVGMIGMINPATHATFEFTVPTTGDSLPMGITAGPDGNLWFTENYANKIGMIDPATHAIAEFALPTAGAYPYGISAGSDGNLWFTEPQVHKIGMINPATHVITEFPVPSSPAGITAGPDGNIWYAAVSSIGMINPATLAIAEYPSPTPSHRITAGPDGNIWVTEYLPGKVASINPANPAAIAEYADPYTGSEPHDITAGPDGNIWFTDMATSAIGVLPLSSSQLVVTQQPPASVTAGLPGFGFTVTAEDSSGNRITSFNGTVTVRLANNPGGAVLGGTLTATASNGMATFSGLTLNKAATGYTLATSGGGFGEGVTGAFTVTPAAAYQLAITQQPPASVTSNAPFGLVAVIEDQYGNVVTSASNAVTVALAANPGGATLGGTTTVVAVDGVVTFSNLTLNKRAKGYTLQLSSTGLAAVTSGPITVK